MFGPVGSHFTLRGGHSALGWNDLGGHSTLGQNDRGSFYLGGQSTLRQWNKIGPPENKQVFRSNTTGDSVIP